jgi:hypothetical protein
MPEPENKAVSFNTLVEVLREITPPAAFQALLAALPRETAQLIERPPLPPTWLPYIHTFTLVRTACDVHFGGDEERTSELARRAVVRDLNSLYRLFTRFASPQYVIDRATRMWDTYWRNNGTVRVEREGSAATLVHFEGMAYATSLFWTMQCGSLRGVMEVTGVQGIEVRIIEGRDDPHGCTIRARWRER